MSKKLFLGTPVILILHLTNFLGSHMTIIFGNDSSDKYISCIYMKNIWVSRVLRTWVIRIYISFYCTRWSRPTGSPSETDHGLYGQSTFIIIGAFCLTKPVWQNSTPPCFASPLKKSQILPPSKNFNSNHFNNTIE